MKAVRTLANDNRTVIARVFAFRACSFKVDATDATSVIRVLGEMPFPGCDRLERRDGDFHFVLEVLWCR